MFTVSVEVNGALFPIKFGAVHTSLEDQEGLARGLSAGISRVGVNRGPVLTVDGPKVPDAIVVTNAAGRVVSRYVDYAVVRYVMVPARHAAGLVELLGSV